MVTEIVFGIAFVLAFVLGAVVGSFLSRRRRIVEDAELDGATYYVRVVNGSGRGQIRRLTSLTVDEPWATPVASDSKFEILKK